MNNEVSFLVVLSFTCTINHVTAQYREARACSRTIILETKFSDTVDIQNELSASARRTTTTTTATATTTTTTTPTKRNDRCRIGVCRNPSREGKSTIQYLCKGRISEEIFARERQIFQNKQSSVWYDSWGGGWGSGNREGRHCGGSEGRRSCGRRFCDRVSW